MNERDDGLAALKAAVANLPKRVSFPAGWYLGAHGDPVARFDYLTLLLHPDGSVSWEREDTEERTTRDGA